MQTNKIFINYKFIIKFLQYPSINSKNLINLHKTFFFLCVSFFILRPIKIIIIIIYVYKKKLEQKNKAAHKKLKIDYLNFLIIIKLKLRVKRQEKKISIKLNVAALNIQLELQEQQQLCAHKISNNVTVCGIFIHEIVDFFFSNIKIIFFHKNLF